MSIKVKLIVAISGILIIVGLVMGIVIYWQNTKKLTEHANTEVKTAINYTSQLVNLYFDKVSSATNSFVNDPLVIEALTTKNPQKLQQVSDKFTIVVESSNAIEAIALFEIKGMACVSRTASQLSLPTVGQDFSDRDYCKGIIKTKAPYLSSAYIGASTKHPNLALVIPVKNNAGEMIGFISGVINVIQLRSYLLDLQKDSKVELLDRYGTMFLNTEEEIEELNKLSSVENVELSKIQKSLAENIKEGYFQDVDNVVAYKSNGDITIIFEESITSLMALSRTLNIILVLTQAITVFLTILIIYFLVGKITKRISQLSQAVDQVAHGKFDIKFEEKDFKTTDEIGILNNAFDRMGERIRISRAEIEAKVDEQTREIIEKSKGVDDQRKAILNILEDVEEEKDKASAEKDKVNAILHSIGDGVFVIDKDFKIILINHVALNMCGVEEKAAIGKKYSNVLRFAHEDRPKIVNDSFIKDAFKTGIVQEMTNHTVLIRSDGTKISVADSCAPLVGKLGKIIGCVVVFRDVTKERNIDRMKTEFISLASHQLRTPLTSMKWFGEMLLNGDAGKLSREQADYVGNIYSSNERMIVLVNSLLNISRIESGRITIDPKPVNLKSLVNGVVKELNEEIIRKKQKLVVGIFPELPKISVDSKLIGEAYENLLSNAIKYTPEKGKISITIFKKRKEIITEISDTGYGIPKLEQPRLFEKFFRGTNIIKHETEGTGLGLYLVKSVVESSGGKIWFESEENKGTTFFFSLPMSGSIAKEGEVTLNS